MKKILFSLLLRLVQSAHERASVSTTITVVVMVIVVVIAAGASALILFAPTAKTSSSSNTSLVTTSATTTKITSSSTQTVPITVGIAPSSDFLPLLVAYHQGYFARQGLNLTIRYLSGGPVITSAVASGSIQIGETSPVSLMANSEQGFNFKFIAPADAIVYPAGTANHTFIPGVSPTALAVLSSSNIFTAKDLVGKTVAINAFGSGVEVNLKQTLTDNGVQASSVNIVAVSPANQIIALEQKRTDAVSLFEPFVTELIVANQTPPTVGAFRIIADPTHYFPEIFLQGYFGTSDWINAHPTVVKAFINALNLGISDIAKNQSVARTVLVTDLKMSPVAASKAVLYTYPMSPIPYRWVQNQLQVGLKYGLLKNSNDDANQLIDPAYMQLSK